MSIETFHVTPPAADAEDRYGELYPGSKPKRAGPCWLCGARTHISKWGDHVERHRREGWKPRAVVTSKDRMAVFAACRQQEATGEDLAGVADALDARESA